MRPSPVWPVAFLTMILAAGIAAIASWPSPWGSWRPATCMPDGCFCEAIRDQLVRQPANAISGLAFVAVGLLVLLSRPASHERSTAPTNLPAFTFLFAMASVLVGLGTAIYHASLTFRGQTADVLAMYLVATLIVLYNLARIVSMSAMAVGATWMLGNAVLLTGLIVVPEARRYTFAGLVLLAIVLEMVARRTEAVARKPRFFLAAMLVLGAGFFIWILDITRVACIPDSWLQGHAMWHLFGAAAVWLIFAYYRS